MSGLLGQPYDAETRHCWWLAGVVQREVFGRELPVWAGPLPSPAVRSGLFRDHPARASWQSFDEVADGDLVLMGRAPGQEIHCGVYLAGHGGVIHTDDPHGVVIDTVLELRAAYGWTHLSYNRPL